MIITPSLRYPESAPIALGGLTSAAQVNASRGIVAAQVGRGSAVYALLRWNTGLNRWESVKLNGVAVTVEPTISAALGEASTEFSAIAGSYYTALLTTSQPNGNAANLIGIAIQDAGSSSGGGSVTLSGDVTGPSGTNIVSKLQGNVLGPLGTLGMGDTNKVLTWTGTEWAAASLPGGATPSDDPPEEIGAPDPGVSPEYSRGDHVHELPDIIDPGTTAYPSSVTVDQYGRVTALVGGSPGTTQETAGAAVAVGLPVMTNGSSRIVVAGTTLADMQALRGISTTAAAANGDPISVAGNSSKTAAVLAGLTIREAQYAAGGALVPESGIAAYVAGAASDSWYRRIGHAIAANQIYEDWGEPQKVP